jgi:dipeptidyl aminopeptidase/acylaminoacyl peptidase
LEWNRLSQFELDEWQRTGRYRVRNEFMDLEIGYGLIAEASDFQFETLAKQFLSPLIIFHGMRDEIVPYTQSLDFAARCAASEVELVISKAGDHRLNCEKEKIARAACDFFAAQSAAVADV